MGWPRRAVVVTILAGVLAACGTLIDVSAIGDGLKDALEAGDVPESSAVEASTPPAVTEDAGPTDVDAAPTDSGAVDSGDAGSDACIPSVSTCKGKCGDVPDGCGHSIACGDCFAGEACSANHTCVITPCVPVSPCPHVLCGLAMNNCNQPVQCPDTCVAPAICGAGDAGPNGCCKPMTEAEACPKSQCRGTAPDGCGGTVNCVAACSLGDGCTTCDGVCSPKPTALTCDCPAAIDCH